MQGDEDARLERDAVAATLERPALREAQQMSRSLLAELDAAQKR